MMTRNFDVEGSSSRGGAAHKKQVEGGNETIPDGEAGGFQTQWSRKGRQGSGKGR